MRRGRLLGGGQGGTSPQAKLRASQSQERLIAREVGGRVQPGSGARWFAKGDVCAPAHLLECKRTDKGSYSLKLSEWKKITNEALSTNRRPVMAIEIQTTRLAVLPWEDYLDLIDK